VTAPAVARRPSPPGEAATDASAAAAASVTGSAAFGPGTWRPLTVSPRPATSVDARDARLYALCGAADASLDEVAARNAERQLEGARLFPADELAFELRVSGEPHVWPRAWSIAGGALADDDVEARVRAWASGGVAFGARRCGVGRRTGSDGSTVVSAIAVDALADLAPLPTTARVGQWLTLEGTMLVPATAVKVVLLGPRGAPRTAVASLSNGRIRSSFAVDQKGAWLVQVLASVSTGPRPVLEAMVFAGEAPPDRFVRSVAPGEDAARGEGDDGAAVVRMINAARATEGLPALRRDATLDRLARDHCERMLHARVVGHDVGDGDVRARLAEVRVSMRIAGENVASASSLENAHRALWASPSHRSNLLLREFSRVGAAALRDERGLVWVTEIFGG
jgi:uncharacterized protein YkwD